MPVQTRKRPAAARPRPEFPCIKCGEEVTSRHHAIECDGCHRWQHRRCCPSITLTFYREAVKKDKTFRWTCTPCVCKIPTSHDVDAMDENMEVDKLPPPPPGFENFLDEELQMMVDGTSNTALAAVELFGCPVAESSHTSDHSPVGSINSFQDQEVINVSLLGQMLGSTVAESFHSPADSIDNISYHQVQEVLEESLLDATVTDDIVDDGDAVQYSIVGSSSQRQRPKLHDSRGFSYTKYSDNKDGSTTWRCSKRNKQMFCGTLVKQRGHHFILGNRDHCHPGQPGQLIQTNIMTQLKKKASLKDHLFDPASQLVDEVLLNNITEVPVPSLPNPRSLARTANRVRQKERPQDPTDLDFVLLHDAIPENFLQTDVRVRKRRHLIFSTPNQQVLLARGKRWYMDATFKVVKAPFSQMFGIHCFVKKEVATKQVPLVFALMSGRKKRDYTAVLRAIRDLLPDDICLKEVLIDFERALWSALSSVFPDVSVKGCGFHWKQAVWRKVQELGLQPAYMEKSDVYKLLQSVLALPFLPAELIPAMFESLRIKAGTPMLQRLFNYVSSTWIESEVWPPSTWSSFRQSIRTNNDCEGWHLRLKTKARKAQVPLYLLILLLHTEARFVDVQVKLVSERKLLRNQKRSYRTNQGRISRYWSEFENGERTAKMLLRACSALQ